MLPLLGHGGTRETTLEQAIPGDSNVISFGSELGKTLLSGVIWRG